MNGADSLVATLVASGVTACFANPGTSEMHFVAALDTAKDMRAVLCLFEGVATGAADGYGRMAESPATTLLHLGPGLANGIANLHNARRARTPLVNVVGDHATYHKRFDAPLESDIDALAGSVSGWVRRPARPADVGADAADAVAAARSGCVASLLLPADVSWGEGGVVAPVRVVRPPGAPFAGAVEDAALALRSGEPVVLLLGGSALRTAGLWAAARIAFGTGAKVIVETFPARAERGAGRPEFERLGYFAEMALAQLDGCRHLLLVGARSPVAFFAYPSSRSDLVPEGCKVHDVCAPGDDAVAALEALAGEVGGGDSGVSLGGGAGSAGSAGGGWTALAGGGGPLTAQSACEIIGALLPEGTIVVDEAITTGLALAAATAEAAPHDWLALTGGAIGQGLPVATGAAVACPDRRVVCVEADGSAMYTLQALWTQAREGLDVTTVLITNRAYAILQVEMHRLRAEPPGPAAAALLDLSNPPIDAASLARGFGVPATTVATGDELHKALTTSLSEPGPSLVEVVLAPR